MKLLISLLSIILTSSCFAQICFENKLSLSDSEPNRAYAIAEFDEEYIIGGNYFAADIELWTGYFAKYDFEGNLLKLYLEKNDTISGLNISNKILQNEEGAFCLGSYLNLEKILHLNTQQDSIYVSFSLDSDINNFNAVDFCWNSTKDNFIFCGSNYHDNSIYRNVKIATMIEDSLKVFEDIYPNGIKSYALNVALNSKEEIVVACVKRTSKVSDHKVYLLFLDSDLNVIKSTKETENEINFVAGRGMLVDSNNDILVTGHIAYLDLDKTHYSPALCKFDSEGNFLWLNEIGNSVDNFDAIAGWNKIIESNNNDGYILIGSEKIGSTLGTDTSKIISAISKTSFEGETIWEKNWSFRNIPNAWDSYHTGYSTSDGGYIFAGNSIDQNNLDPNNDPWIYSTLVKTNENATCEPSSVSQNNLSQVQIEVDYDFYSKSMTVNNENSIEYEFLLISSFGNQIQKYKISKNNTSVIDFSHLRSGVYFATIINSKTSISKIIIY